MSGSPGIDADCSSCGEDGCKRGECPSSKRPCGHHCDCSWTQDRCCWCGEEFGEMDGSDKPIAASTPPDPLRPNGRCTCNGEGRCEWCVETRGGGR